MALLFQQLGAAMDWHGSGLLPRAGAHEAGIGLSVCILDQMAMQRHLVTIPKTIASGNAIYNLTHFSLIQVND